MDRLNPRRCGTPTKRPANRKLMKGRPPLVDKDLEPCPASQWTAGLGTALRKARLLKHPLKTSLPLEIRETPLCVWLIFTLDKNLKLGIRAPSDPSGLRTVRLTKPKARAIEIVGEGGLGTFRVAVSIHESPDVLLRCTTTLTPTRPLRLEALPRDLCMLDGRFEPYGGTGRLYTCQTVNSAGQAFFSAPEGRGGTVFYFQNLSALEDYFRVTGTKLSKTVAGQWPVSGFALPGSSMPLEEGRAVVIGDAFIELRQGLPDGEAEAGKQFLDSLGRIYPMMPQPEFDYYDWPAMSEKVLRTLNSPSCSRTLDRKMFLHAYIGGSGKPPESMVQGAITVPVMEYEAWRRRPVPLIKRLRHVPESFYHPKLKTLVRWLPGAGFEKEDLSEEEKEFRMDSWYLLHTMVNLARLAEMDARMARDELWKCRS